jgi:hypothetical protein
VHPWLVCFVTPKERFMRWIVAGFLASVLFSQAAMADRYYSRTVVRTTAQQDAEYMARTGRFGHRGTCGCREGIGMGSTAEQALANCCYNDGRYVIRERAVVRGGNGRYYAVIRYGN